MMLDFTGQPAIFGSGPLVYTEYFNQYLENRSMEDIRFFVSDKPIGPILNSFINYNTIEYAAKDNEACSIKTKEDLYLVFYSIYGNIAPREAGNRVARDSIIFLMELLEDPDMYLLAEKDVLWFDKIASKYFDYTYDGTSVFIENISGLGYYLSENYNLLLNEPKDSNLTEINFIYNRLNSIYVDPGKLAMLVVNYVRGSSHQIKLF